MFRYVLSLHTCIYFSYLGTGAEHTLVEPKVIKLPSKSLAALKLSAGKYHSLILTENNEVN